MLKWSNGSPLKRVVMLGGTGFVGSHLTDELNRINANTLKFSSSDLDLTDEESIFHLREHAKETDSFVFLAFRKGRGGKNFIENVSMAETFATFLKTTKARQVVYTKSAAHGYTIAMLVCGVLAVTSYIGLRQTQKKEG